MAYDKKEKKVVHAEHHAHGDDHFREKHLMLDPLPRGQMNDMVMKSMTEPPTWKFWLVFGILSVIVAYGLFYSWARLIIEGVGITGVNRPAIGASSL